MFVLMALKGRHVSIELRDEGVVHGRLESVDVSMKYCRKIESFTKQHSKLALDQRAVRFAKGITVVCVCAIALKTKQIGTCVDHA